MASGKKKKKYSDVRIFLVTALAVTFLIVLAACIYLVLSRANGSLLDFGKSVRAKTYRLEYSDLVEEASKKYGLEEARIYAVMLVESSFRPEAVSEAGAVGLMQMLPATYESLCLKRGVEYNPEDLKDPATNIDFCCEYLVYLKEQMGSWDMTHLAYHAGIGRVNGWLADPECSADGITVDRIPSSVSAKYVERINAAYFVYKEVLAQKAEEEGKTKTSAEAETDKTNPMEV